MASKTKKTRKFLIPGIYHPIEVRLVSRKWLKRYTKEATILGQYEHFQGLIYLASDLTPEVMIHTLFHEVSHHILDTLEDIKDEEQRCDLLGSYLLKLHQKKDKIKKSLRG